MHEGNIEELVPLKFLACSATVHRGLKKQRVGHGTMAVSAGIPIDIHYCRCGLSKIEMNDNYRE